MFVASFPAPMYATNCWIIAGGRGQECIIVDPGMPDISHEIRAIIEENDLKPVAALITHGHLDHTFSVKPLADGYGIASYIHSEDREYLLKPQGAHGPEFIATLDAMSFEEPTDTRNLRHGDLLEILDLKITAIHSPGHTRGSTMFNINDELLISGDVLFAGSIGRTDLPSGSHEAMAKTLKTRVLPLSDDLRVLPGHGPETTIKFERKNNPYLKELRI
jgi:hydroxyacylglutathione hydrolase|uniref:MBL fold metallo-hydrolase n=1 Tax=Candidatus Planktophila sp. TaxID=2175601 RepID=UPI00404AA96D